MSGDNIVPICILVYCYVASCFTWGREIADDGDGVFKIAAWTLLLCCVPVFGQMALGFGGLLPIIGPLIWLAERRA